MNGSYGRAVAQVVSRRFATEAVRVRSQVKLCWICGGYSGTGGGFLRVLLIPLPLIHSNNYSTIIIIIWSCYNRPINGRSNSGLGSTPASRINKRDKDQHIKTAITKIIFFRKNETESSLIAEKQTEASLDAGSDSGKTNIVRHVAIQSTNLQAVTMPNSISV
jgi:hypothetical protein